MSWQSYQRAAERGPTSIFFKVLGAVLVFVITIGVVGFILNPFQQAGRIFNKTIDADNVIYNYEWFKRQHESIEAIDNKIRQQEVGLEEFKSELGDRENWDRIDKEEYARLNSVLIGLNQQREDMTAEYNARSRMVNRSIFKAGDIELPERID